MITGTAKVISKIFRSKVDKYIYVDKIYVVVFFNSRVLKSG